MATLTAYFDETGLSSDEKLCVVAGFVGNDAQWTSFAADWIPALGQRRNLHVRKLRWKQHYKRIASDLKGLGRIPRKFNLIPVLSGIRHRDYEEIMKGRVREKYTNPYMTCAQACISTVLKFVAGPEDEVLFIFDRQEGRRAEAIERLHEIVFKWARVDPRFKDILLVNHETTVCLDPADYLAFAIRENVVNRQGQKARATKPILAGYRKWRSGIFSRKQISNMTKRAIAAGMVPGGGAIQVTPDFAATLREAGWRETKVRQLTELLKSMK